MDSFSSLGVNRSDTRRYREDLQRQLGNEDTILCKRFSETKYQSSAQVNAFVYNIYFIFSPMPLSLATTARHRDSPRT
jgi:hypothetical protein